MRQTRVCLVIPAYNEAARLPGFLSNIADRLAEARLDAAIDFVVVDDGSVEGQRQTHHDAVAAFSSRLNGGRHRARIIQAPRNQGKAAAIVLGWTNAPPSADWLGFVDADGAISATELLRLISMLPAAHFDALAGSRVKMAGRQIVRSGFRHLQGRVFATLTEVLFGLGFYDPQCGVKFFRARLLGSRLPLLQERTWLLDVEALAVVKRSGGTLREEPIDWADGGESKVRFGIDALRMGRGLVALRRRLDRQRCD